MEISLSLDLETFGLGFILSWHPEDKFFTLVIICFHFMIVWDKGKERRSEV